MSHTAETSIRNSLMFLELALRNEDLSGHAAELLDQAQAVMQAAIESLHVQPLPVEFGYHLCNAINELEACQRLSTGILKSSVFNATAALEKIRGDL